MCLRDKRARGVKDNRFFGEVRLAQQMGAGVSTTQGVLSFLEFRARVPAKRF